MRITAEEVESEFESWLEKNWDPHLNLRDWREIFVGSGWAVPSWPIEWHGLGLPVWSERLIFAVLRRRGAIGLPLGGGTTLAAPTILHHGPDGLRERFLRPTLCGLMTWCQLFSEPGAGSDLAGVTTSAVLDGDRWIVNGQKVWTTSADHADFGILLARTDWSLPKHEGLSYLVLPMGQPGVDARPLRQMNGHSTFNEVFLTNAEIPADFIVGGIGQGWRVAQTTLAFERKFGAMPQIVTTGRSGRIFEEAASEAERHRRTYAWYPQRAGRPDRLIGHAREAGRSTDPTIRQEIARSICWQQASKWTASRAVASMQLGRSPGPEGSLGKLASSVIARHAAHVHAVIAGPAATLVDGKGAIDGLLSEVLLSVPAQSIAGGSDEVQKNILAERVLGLPREVDESRDKPFSEVPKNAYRQVQGRSRLSEGK